jgi:hypothetical protein
MGIIMESNGIYLNKIYIIYRKNEDSRMQKENVVIVTTDFM